MKKEKKKNLRHGNRTMQVHDIFLPKAKTWYLIFFLTLQVHEAVLAQLGSFFSALLDVEEVNRAEVAESLVSLRASLLEATEKSTQAAVADSSNKAR